MPVTPDTKKALEAILGYELSEEAVQRIQLIQAVASHTRSDLPGEGFITKKNILVSRPNSCEETILLDVSGIAITASDGKSLFRLTDFICPSGDESFLPPINVVATPISSQPCFLTVMHSLVNDAADVEIQVSTWDTNGASAPNVSFNWRCRVGLVRIIL